MFITYVTLLRVTALLFHPHQEPFIFVQRVILLRVVLVAICWLKGEPPRWRWGEE